MSTITNTTASELALIGAVILSDGKITNEIDLAPDDFTVPYCRELFATARQCADSGSVFDIAVAANVMTRTLRPDAAVDYVKDLVDLAPSQQAWPGHVKIIREAARMRFIQSAADTAMLDASDAADCAIRLADAARCVLYSETEKRARTLSELIRSVMSGNFRDPSRQIKTGFPILDRLTKGFWSGQLILIGARPAVGKSIMALQLALNAVKQGKHVLFMSLEMLGEEIGERVLANALHGAVKLDALTDGSYKDNDGETVAAAAEILEQHSDALRVVDKSALTLQDIQMYSRLYPDTDIIIIDYLQLMATNHNKEGNRNLEVSELSRGLKVLASELEIPIIAISQLSRPPAAARNRIPSLSDLRDSGSLEQDANLVILMSPLEGTDRLIDVAKNRSGATGRIRFGFDGSTMTFAEKGIWSPKELPSSNPFK